MRQSAKFISFEGTEGVGKTTAMASLCQQLDSVGIDYIRTREPGGSAFAEILRSLLLDPNTTINEDTELLLMFAARSDHLDKVILPALAKGQWVICDRFIDSSVAYQGFGRVSDDMASSAANGLSSKDLISRGSHSNEQLAKIGYLIEHFVPKLPDMTVWLDLPVDEGMQRAGKRGKADRFEQETLTFFTQAYQGFVHQYTQHPERIVRIDASGDAAVVADKVWSALKAKLLSDNPLNNN